VVTAGAQRLLLLLVVAAVVAGIGIGMRVFRAMAGG
jgi:hypothetical protein